LLRRNILYTTWRNLGRLRGLAAFLTLLLAAAAAAQDIPPELLDEAARATGLSKEELQHRYQQQMAAPATTPAVREPGRQTLDDVMPRGVGRAETSYWPEKPVVRLPDEPGSGDELSVATAESVLSKLDGPAPLAVFGRSFFALSARGFTPSSFGPVPASYVIGIGDEIIVDVWGEVEFRESRIVERDGSIILPKGGKINVHGRTLGAVEADIRQHLARSYAGLANGTIQLDVTLGALRTIRVFVIGEATRPGGYDLSSASTVFTALYASGGPGEDGSLRDIRLLRDGQVVARLDLYRFLLEGIRDGDEGLRDGDTVLIPERSRTVLLQGAVRRPAFYELMPGESVADLVRFGGGFTAQAASDLVHIERIVPVAKRLPNLPDRTFVDVALDPATGGVRDSGLDLLLDGDVVTVDAIQDKLWGWVAVAGHVKRPGRYEYTPGLTVRELLAKAGGTWPDVLNDIAVIDRIDPQENTYTVTLPLGEILAGRQPDVPLQERDELKIFSRGGMLDREQVSAAGVVREPGDFVYRRGMTLKDLLARAGGVPVTADLSRVEVHRLRQDKVFDPSAQPPVGPTVDVLFFDLRPDWMQAAGEVALEPYDRLVVRQLPWYERQRNVSIQGEVLYNGTFSLTSKDETLSSVLARAGGLKATAYAPGARIVRREVGNVAIDLVQALARPGGDQDVLLQEGDVIIVPEQQFTVKVVGEVGFSTALVYEDGKKIDWYVDRAGGYLENADKKRTRVIHPNGLSFANKGGHKVLPGSTIVVPVEPPPEGPTSLETLKEIAVIFSSLATVWLVVDQVSK
jgi:protein involved in polysaccharide export with SLBB domain